VDGDVTFARLFAKIEKLLGAERLQPLYARIGDDAGTLQFWQDSKQKLADLCTGECLRVMIQDADESIKDDVSASECSTTDRSTHTQKTTRFREIELNRRDQRRRLAQQLMHQF
jgi:hypothetical protein